MIAVILTGGLGTRLHPLTLTTPKPMLPIGELPHLEYQIRLLKQHGFRDIIFCTGYLHEQIVEYFGRTPRETMRKHGVMIRYKQDGPEPLGTAGALRNCLDLIDEQFVLVMNGDILTDIDLTAMKNAFMQALNPIMIALTPTLTPTQYGVAKINDSKKVVKFIEKPQDDSFGNLISAGIYMMSRNVIQYHILEGPSMIEDTLFPIFANARLLSAYTGDFNWLDIGTHEHYALAQRDVQRFL
jgi:mannose-1-phosphate guanylyltransferase/phosphomannomutase